MRRDSSTIVAVAEQSVLRIVVCVCSLRYAECNAMRRIILSIM